MTPFELEERIARALRGGPLYTPLLELVVGASGRQVKAALGRMNAAGAIERAYEIGPQTWRLTETDRP